MNLTKDQQQKFSSYQSLNLRDKPYQEKTLLLATKYFLTHHPKNPQLLDIGCADGSFAAHAAKELNFTATGIELSSAVYHAKKILTRAQKHDLSTPLPFPNNSFHLIFATEVIEHLFDTDLFLSEIKRVLKPNGLLILTTPNLASLKNRLRLLFNHYPQYLEYSTLGAGHIHLYTLPILVDQLKHHHLKVVSAASVNFLSPFITKSWYPKFLRHLAFISGDLLPTLGSHLIVSATR